MPRPFLAIPLVAALAGACATTSYQSPDDIRALRDEVAATERAFAKTMADRDLTAFAGFVADEAVFLNGGSPLRGKDAVVAHWRRLFDGPNAPFSWSPDLVEVLASGTLAESIGPVADPSGAVVARFYSTWRREAPGVWRIVFDNGYDVCPPAAPPTPPAPPTPH